MIKFIKNLFGFGAEKSVQETVVPQAPYKIEPPVVTNKVKALSTPIKEGGQRANVKKPNPNNPKPSAPQRPTAKPKSKPKAKRK